MSYQIIEVVDFGFGNGPHTKNVINVYFPKKWFMWLVASQKLFLNLSHEYDCKSYRHFCSHSYCKCLSLKFKDFPLRISLVKFPKNVVGIGGFLEQKWLLSS